MGYIGKRMSERAMESYSNGHMPLSKWTKRNILNAIREYLDDNSCDCNKRYFSNFTKDELFNEFIEYKSWHHTGKFYSETDFYGLNKNKMEDLIEFIDTGLEKTELILKENNINYKKFNINQIYNVYILTEIGLDKGIDISTFADTKFSKFQMREIRKGLESGVDVSVYASKKYHTLQMEQIRKGLESGVDVSAYTDPKFEDNQMYEIRKGLENGVDVSLYADERFNSLQMQQIRGGLENGLSIDEIINEEKRGYEVER